MEAAGKPRRALRVVPPAAKELGYLSCTAEGCPSGESLWSLLACPVWLSRPPEQIALRKESGQFAVSLWHVWNVSAEGVWVGPVSPTTGTVFFTCVSGASHAASEKRG